MLRGICELDTEGFVPASTIPCTGSLSCVPVSCNLLFNPSCNLFWVTGTSAARGTLRVLNDDDMSLSSLKALLDGWRKSVFDAAPLVFALFQVGIWKKQVTISRVVAYNLSIILNEITRQTWKTGELYNLEHWNSAIHNDFTQVLSSACGSVAVLSAHENNPQFEASEWNMQSKFEYTGAVKFSWCEWRVAEGGGWSSASSILPPGEPWIRQGCLFAAIRSKLWLCINIPFQ